MITPMRISNSYIATALTPDYAWVWWDYDAEAYCIECWACDKAPVTKHSGELTDRQIKNILLAAAERHNQENHYDC